MQSIKVLVNSYLAFCLHSDGEPDSFNDVFTCLVIEWSMEIGSGNTSISLCTDK